MTFVAFALLAVSVPVLAATGYLLVLTLLSRSGAPPAGGPPRLRFDVLVPAHDEQVGIGRTVTNLLALRWPRELFRVLVVADNCSDDTAALAAAAGATVLVRNDASRRGKGYALEAGFARIRADGLSDATVVVDADTLVSPDLLARFAAHLEAGHPALQARYGVLNRDASWRTRLMAIAFAMFHDVRSLGRNRLGVSCGLRGNGMCFANEVLDRVPHDAFSIVEDLEYGIRLGLAGIRVGYVHEVEVRGEMAAQGSGVGTQRARWEGGRRQIRRQYARPLLREGLRRRDRVLLDLAADVLLPPLASIGVAALAGLVLAAIAVYLGSPAWTLVPWALALLFLSIHVARGLQLSGAGVRGAYALALAPAYVAWKLVFAARGARPGREWVRTSRVDPPA
ncbi:MAG TPA: glycosyltransferase family 2 protein [Anaeromyxobacteraceae bacterium]|nr:glycosyltransferase family 2 protein [Anaeromyxobacteraceae bacterium]